MQLCSRVAASHQHSGLQDCKTEWPACPYQAHPGSLVTVYVQDKKTRQNTQREDCNSGPFFTGGGQSKLGSQAHLNGWTMQKT